MHHGSNRILCVGNVGSNDTGRTPLEPSGGKDGAQRALAIIIRRSGFGNQSVAIPQNSLRFVKPWFYPLDGKALVPNAHERLVYDDGFKRSEWDHGLYYTADEKDEKKGCNTKSMGEEKSRCYNKTPAVLRGNYGYNNAYN